MTLPPSPRLVLRREEVLSPKIEIGKNQYRSQGAKASGSAQTSGLSSNETCRRGGWLMTGGDT
jgi:hypothetical protein